MRLIVVSNRLPVTVVDRGEDVTLTQSIGGLATGISAFLKGFKELKKDSEYIWFGWPGITVKPARETIISSELNALNCYPIFIAETMMEKFNEGFCNKTLWPIFHYFTSYHFYEEEHWATYKKVNEFFCNKITEIIKPDDVIWIHDYHLMLLPMLLRNRFPNITIGFFLHIPFPSFEIFQILPKKCRSEILNGILGSDLIGFHTHEYTQNFTKSVLRVLGCEHHMDFLSMNDRLIKVSTYPMSIDFKYIQKFAMTQRDSSSVNKFLNLTKNQKIILSIDRLDYTKGITNRLYAYEKFLNENPTWRKSVVLVLLVAPSREKVGHYQTMKKQIDELVGRINGKFGDIEWTPILYQYKTFTLDQLIALYEVSDVSLVTPLRDGMNLIAKEYLSSRIDQKGVLILSETAGAAKELLDAIIINPHCIEEMSSALKQAVEMSTHEQNQRISVMQSRLRRYDVIRWGMEILLELTSIKDKQENFFGNFLKDEKIQEIQREFRRPGKKLFLLDYDGTLVPFVSNPTFACPNEEVLNLLKELSADVDTKVVIVSGRDKDTLERWMGHLNIDLVAEHGVWIRVNNAWKLSKHLVNNWKTHVDSVFENFSDKLPGTFIERKEFSIAWHYRNANPEKGSQLAKELADYLVSLTSNGDIRILLGNKVVEAICSGIGKDVAVMRYISRYDYNFILALGDDVTDEDMFKVLPEKAYSIKIGNEITSAKFRVATQKDGLQILKGLNMTATECEI